MDKAKQAVQNFVSRDGKHTTTVHEDVRGAVTDEHVRAHQHEEVNTAVDRETHQHHHHTTVQPISHQETLPEKHTHNATPVEHKTFQHGKENDSRDIEAADRAKFQNSSTTHDTTHSSSVAPVVAGEHTHHHVHEHVQPVIQKETIQPHTVHTTVPVHETHHAAAVQHDTSILPSKTMDEFTQGGGSLEGRAKAKVSEHQGVPPLFQKDLHSTSN